MSRSGEIFSPCKGMSSPVFTITVSARGSITSCRPSRSLDAPTPPASAVIFLCFAGDMRMCAALRRKTLGIGEMLRTVAHASREEIAAPHEFRIQREPLPEREPASLRFGAQLCDLWPGRFGVDEILCDRRDAAPIVDSRFQQARKVCVAEIGRRLQVHVRPQN